VSKWEPDRKSSISAFHVQDVRATFCVESRVVVPRQPSVAIVGQDRRLLVQFV
jgi:hypothetical protein